MGQARPTIGREEPTEALTNAPAKKKGAIDPNGPVDLRQHYEDGTLDKVSLNTLYVKRIPCL